MSHRRSVESEFTRQAESFAAAPVLARDDLVQPIADALSDARRVVDLACGPGVVSERLRTPGRTLVGIDLTARVLRLARERLGSHAEAPVWIRGAAEAAPLEGAWADGVVLRLALHHVEAPVTVLREARRLLRPGGRVVVLDVLNSADPELARLRDAIEILRDPSHVSLPTKEGLRAQLEEAGLELAEAREWTQRRRFAEWAAIIADAPRMHSLEQVLLALEAAGQPCGMNLRRGDEGELVFDYRFGFFVAERA